MSLVEFPTSEMDSSAPGLSSLTLGSKSDHPRATRVPTPTSQTDVSTMDSSQRTPPTSFWIGLEQG